MPVPDATTHTLPATPSRGPARAVRRHLARPGTLRDVVAFAVAVAVAFGVTAAVFAILGADPWQAYGAIVSGAFGSSYSLNQTLHVTTALILTATAALLPFRAGVLNVGGDGQFAVGAVAATAGIFTVAPHSGGLVVLLAVVAGAAAGGLWSGMVGYLRVRVGANEVIVGLMLNFVAALLADYVISGRWADRLAPQTRTFSSGSGVPSPNWLGGDFATGLLIAVAVVAGVWVLVERSRFGFLVRVVGSNADAGRRAGIAFPSVVVRVMLIGGALAGLGGALQAITVDHALIQNPAQGYGYTGIAVALLAGLRPGLVIPSALFFAALSVGANALPAVTGISTSAASIVQGVFVIGLIATGVVRVRSVQGP